jgi:signal transduction histidine kinase
MTTEREHTTGELARAAAEQAALRRVATLVAAGAPEVELLSAVTYEIGRLFGAQRANTMRWEGDTIRVIGDWSEDAGEMHGIGRVYSYGGDTITPRVVETRGPARINSADDLHSQFARDRWADLGLEASIGAPIIVDGEIWGLVTASRVHPDDPFPPGAEHRLGDFAALVAQAIANAETRRETAALVAEQSALRSVATLVAAGRPQAEVLDAVTREVTSLFGATATHIVRWEGVQDEVVIIAGWNDDGTPVEPGSLFHPASGSATLTVLETGYASRSRESSPERGACSVIAAPVIVNASLLGALTALRFGDEVFTSGAEVRLRSFADLAAQSIANERAQADLRASRARLVSTADETRRRLERNLHDGAQQRLVSVSIAIRLATAKLVADPDEARSMLVSASEELTQALQELRDLARGLHPSILTDRGLGPALEALCGRAPLPVRLVNEVECSLPTSVEAALYYLVAEALTNVAKYADATAADVHVICSAAAARVEVADNGLGGADPEGGSGLSGLIDRIEALGGRLGIESPPGGGTRVWAELPLPSAALARS